MYLRGYSEFFLRWVKIEKILILQFCASQKIEVQLQLMRIAKVYEGVGAYLSIHRTAVKLSQKHSRLIKRSLNHMLSTFFFLFFEAPCLGEIFISKLKERVEKLKLKANQQKSNSRARHGSTNHCHDNRKMVREICGVSSFVS